MGTIIRVTAKKRHLLTPRFGTCMYDPYTSTHTIIRVTAKKRHLLTPRFGTCMYDPYTSTHTSISNSNSNRNPFPLEYKPPPLKPWGQKGIFGTSTQTSPPFTRSPPNIFPQTSL